jgi:hypothetical protein
VLGTPAPQRGDVVVVQRPNRAPEALLWLNPFVGDLDLICTTAPGGYQRESCDYVAAVTGTPFFATGTDGIFPVGVDDTMRWKLGAAVEPSVNIAAGPIGVARGPAVSDAGPLQQGVATFGFPRDTFWPKSALAFAVVGVVLTLLSAQLVAPTRRLHVPRLRRAGPHARPTDEVTR